MGVEAAAQLRGQPVGQRLTWADRAIHGLWRLFDSRAEDRPRRIRKVRELYPYTRLSQLIFDILYRVLLNLGNWFTSSALFLEHGYCAFQASRERYRKEARYLPPIHVPAKHARKELERLLLAKRVEWEG